MDKIENKPLGFQIRETSHFVHQFVDSFLNENMNLDVSGVEGFALGRICGYYKSNPKEPLTAKKLMDFIKIKKAGMSKLLSNLEKKGYIVIEKSSKDSRSKEIALSELGIKVQQNFSLCFSKINAILEQNIKKEEIDTVLRVLKQIKENIEGGSK